MPSVRHSWLPAKLSRVLPQDPHLIGYIFLMPEAISEHLTRSSVGLDELQYNSGFSFGTERGRFPIDLLSLLPVNNVKMSIILVGKNEAHEIVVVVVIINVEGSFEVDVTQLIRSFCRQRRRWKGYTKMRYFFLELIIN